MFIKNQKSWLSKLAKTFDCWDGRRIVKQKIWSKTLPCIGFQHDENVLCVDMMWRKVMTTSGGAATAKSAKVCCICMSACVCTSQPSRSRWNKGGCFRRHRDHCFVVRVALGIRVRLKRGHGGQNGLWAEWEGQEINGFQIRDSSLFSACSFLVMMSNYDFLVSFDSYWIALSNDIKFSLESYFLTQLWPNKQFLWP